MEGVRVRFHPECIQNPPLLGFLKRPTPPGGSTCATALYNAVGDFFGPNMGMRLRLDCYPLVQKRLHPFPAKRKFLATHIIYDKAGNPHT